MTGFVMSLLLIEVQLDSCGSVGDTCGWSWWCQAEPRLALSLESLHAWHLDAPRMLYATSHPHRIKCVIGIQQYTANTF